MKFIEWFLNLFIGKKAKTEKIKALIQMNNANKAYQLAKEKNDKYLTKYSGKRRYTKV
jgi:hypothetical protein